MLFDKLTAEELIIDGRAKKCTASFPRAIVRFPSEQLNAQPRRTRKRRFLGTAESQQKRAIAISGDMNMLTPISPKAHVSSRAGNDSVSPVAPAATITWWVIAPLRSAFNLADVRHV